MKGLRINKFYRVGRVSYPASKWAVKIYRVSCSICRERIPIYDLFYRQIRSYLKDKKIRELKDINIPGLRGIIGRIQGTSIGA
jgi:hypothetical protein